MADNTIQILFEAIDKNVKKTVEDLKKSLDVSGDSAYTFGEGLQNAFAATGGTLAAVTAGVLLIGKAFEDVVKLSQEKPELFTAEQLQQVNDYDVAIKALGDSFNELKVKYLAPLMGNLAEHTLQMRDSLKEYDAYGHVIDDSMRLAVDATESFDRALMNTRDTSNDVFEGSKNLLSMMEKLSGASDEQTARIIYNNLLQKLSVDGITESEMEMATQAGVALGIFDEKTANSAMKISEFTDKVIDGTFAVENLGAALNSLKDRTITVEVNATGSGLNLLGASGDTRARVGIRNRDRDSAFGDSKTIISNGGGGIDEDKLARKIVSAISRGQRGQE